MIGPKFILQQDNDPKHTAKVIKNYLKKSWKWNVPTEFLQVSCVFILHGFSVHFTGSTDVVSCSVHGVRDPATAAMHIVLGKPSPYIYYTVDKIILRII